MSRAYAYIYTVRDVNNGEVAVVGGSCECAKTIGVAKGTITDAAKKLETGHGRLVKGRYTVTREPDQRVHKLNRYYKVYLTETGELVCTGTSYECMKALGLGSIEQFRHMCLEYRNGVTHKWTITQVPYVEVSPDRSRVGTADNSAKGRVRNYTKSSGFLGPRLISGYYHVYLAKTGELICEGYAKDCAEAMGMKCTTDFNVLTHRVRTGKNKKYIITHESVRDMLGIYEGDLS